MPEPNLGDSAVGQVYMVTSFGRLNGQTIINTFHYRLTEVATVPLTVWEMYEALMEDLSAPDDLFDKLLDAVSTSFVQEKVRVQLLYPTRRMFRDFDGNGGGTRVGTALPQNVAASIGRKGDGIGRTGIGRVQIAGLIESDNNAGNLSAGAITVLQPLANQIGTSLALDGGGGLADPVIFSSPPQGNPNYVVISQTQVQNTVRVMRRRTVGLGI